jgi:hypothetical protein
MVNLAVVLDILKLEKIYYTYIVGKNKRKAEIVEGEYTIVIPSC